MELTQLLISLSLVFFGAYFGMCGAIYWVRRLKTPDDFDFNLPLGLCLILPILIATPFVDFFDNTHQSLYFTGIASLSLLALFLATYPFKTIQRFAVLTLFSFGATYLLPADLPLFQNGAALAVLSRLALAVGLTGFMYLFAWMDAVPFLSLSTSLAFVILTLLLTVVAKILPIPTVFFALFIVTTQMGVTLCLKPFMPFRLGEYGAYAIAFLWGFIGVYLAASGYTSIALFASGYYLTELAFVFITTFFSMQVLGFKTAYLIEHAIQTNIQVPRIFRIVLVYTIALGLLGLWNAHNTNIVFVGFAFLLLGNLVYQFLHWSVRPSFKNVYADLKNGYSELKREIAEVKEIRAQRLQEKKEKATTMPEPKKTQKKQEQASKKNSHSIINTKKTTPKKSTVKKVEPKKDVVQKTLAKTAPKKSVKPKKTTGKTNTQKTRSTQTMKKASARKTKK